MRLDFTMMFPEVHVKRVRQEHIPAILRLWGVHRAPVETTRIKEEQPRVDTAQLVV